MLKPKPAGNGKRRVKANHCSLKKHLISFDISPTKKKKGISNQILTSPNVPIINYNWQVHSTTYRPNKFSSREFKKSINSSKEKLDAHLGLKH